MTAQKRSSAKAAALVLLVIAIALSSGCIDQQISPPVWDHKPEIGTVIDSNEVVIFTEKWRVQEQDGSYTYHAKIISGREFLVTPGFYGNLTLNVTGVGYSEGGNALPMIGMSNMETIYGFFPVNVTQYQDVVNRKVVVP